MREADMAWTDVERAREPSPSDIECECLWCHPSPLVYQQEPCIYCGCADGAPCSLCDRTRENHPAPWITPHAFVTA